MVPHTRTRHAHVHAPAAIVRALPLGILLLALPVTADATVRRVPQDHPTVTAALAAAAPGDLIEVAAGRFAPSANAETFPLVVPAGVELRGAGMGLSVLDAEGTASVVRFTGGDGVLRGFTITGGDAVRGGGLQIEAGTPEIADNLITDNRALDRGSGVNIQGDAAPWIHHNVIWANLDRDLDHFGDPHGVQCGIDSTGLIEHNLIGRTDSNGLFVQETAAPVIRHNIFYENGIVGWRGRGICNFGLPATVIAYNLFHGNVISALVMRDAQGVIVNVSATVADAEFADDGLYGNLDGDPLFSDVNASDFSLTAGSPAIDAGDPSLPGDPDGTRADLGPFRFEATTSAPPRDRGDLLLLGNTPNPFNPSTEIRLRLLRGQSLRVDVVDVRGRVVRALHRGDLEAGDHALRWDGRDDVGVGVASGVYLVHVTAPDRTLSHPMLLVR